MRTVESIALSAAYGSGRGCPRPSATCIPPVTAGSQRTRLAVARPVQPSIAHSTNSYVTSAASTYSDCSNSGFARISRCRRIARYASSESASACSPSRLTWKTSSASPQMKPSEDAAGGRRHRRPVEHHQHQEAGAQDREPVRQRHDRQHQARHAGDRDDGEGVARAHRLPAGAGARRAGVTAGAAAGAAGCAGSKSSSITSRARSIRASGSASTCASSCLALAAHADHAPHRIAGGKHAAEP